MKRLVFGCALAGALFLGGVTVGMAVGKPCRRGGGQEGGVFVLCRFDLKADADRRAYVGKTLDVVPTVRGEKGCRVYTLLEDAKTDWDKPQRFGERTLWMLERWDSIEALKAHLDTPHMKAFGPTVRDLRENGTFHVLQEVVRD